MIHAEPKDLEVKTIFGYLLGGVAPRPIALVSTISKEGQVNLSPFSFFNAFGANPPTVAFSPSRRVRDNSTKDTYENLIATEECVIQAVTHSMVQQVSLASTEFDSSVNEFDKTGLTPIESDLVRPPRVKESPFQMECRLAQMVTLGEKHGSGNLAICEVVKFHIAEEIFENGVIQPERIDLVSRMSADYYCRASGEAVFVVKKPIATIGIGYDNLPEFIRSSKILTANNLGQLGNVEAIPDHAAQQEFAETKSEIEGGREAFLRFERLGEYADMFAVARFLSHECSESASAMMMQAARRALDFDDVNFAWNAALYSQRVISSS